MSNVHLFSPLPDLPQSLGWNQPGQGAEPDNGVREESYRETAPRRLRWKRDRILHHGGYVIARTIEKRRHLHMREYFEYRVLLSLFKCCTVDRPRVVKFCSGRVVEYRLQQMLIVWVWECSEEVSKRFPHGGKGIFVFIVLGAFR